ncbi:MAG: dihydroorotase [Bacteroidota bacterium]|nr:dihydroorotase [Bacteroidota bacterium]
MASSFLISRAKIVNEGHAFEGSVLIENGIIKEIRHGSFEEKDIPGHIKVIDARGKYLIPGVIDDQVHFRDPGITVKGDIASESRAAVAGGTTSFMDMPNTIPQTTTIPLLEDKMNRASCVSFANYSFFLGATQDNLIEIEKTDPHKICGIKVFLGSSTGNMLVNDPEILEKIFKRAPTIVAVHSEEEEIIRKNLAEFKTRFGENIPFSAHPLIRSAEACYTSSKKAITLAKRCGTRLHILHLSTARELDLLDNSIPLEQKQITAEVCIQHLLFSDRDYDMMGARIKWNPAIKSENDREALFQALLNDKIDIIATDHAPHTMEEKQKPYLSCPSGGPMVQHSLVAMMEFFHKGNISMEKIVEKMCHGPAILYRIQKRGFIRKGYFADLVLVDPDNPWEVSPANILYKCGWSPFEGVRFRSQVTHTFVNGNLVYEKGAFDESSKGMRLEFN